MDILELKDVAQPIRGNLERRRARSPEFTNLKRLEETRDELRGAIDKTDKALLENPIPYDLASKLTPTIFEFND